MSNEQWTFNMFQLLSLNSRVVLTFTRLLKICVTLMPIIHIFHISYQKIRMSQFYVNFQQLVLGSDVMCAEYLQSVTSDSVAKPKHSAGQESCSQ